MKKQKRRINKKELEKANSEIEIPQNVNFVEISMSHERLDEVAQQHSKRLGQLNDPILRKRTVRRQEKLLRKIFKTASQVLTDSQFQIFTLRYVYNMPEKEIAQQINRNRSYIPLVLRNSIKKIQKRLRIPISLKEFGKNRKSTDE